MKSDPTAFGLFMAVFLMMIGVGMIVAVMPRHYIALSGSPHTVGSLAAAFATAYLMVQLVVARLADRYGFRILIIAGYFICSLAGLCFYLSTDALMLIAGRLIQGFGEAPIWSLAPAMLAIRYPDKAGRMIGGYSAVLHVGLALGPLLGIVSRRFMPVESVFVLFALLCSCGGVILILTLRADRPMAEEKKSQAFGQGPVAILPSDRRIRATLLGVGLYGAGYGTFLTVIPVYLQTTKAIGQTGIGLYFTGFYVAIGVAAYLSGVLADRYERRGFMIAGLALGALGIAFVPAVDAVCLAVLLVAAMLAMGIFGISAFAYLNDMVPVALKGSLSGYYFLSWGLGMFAGPLVIGGMEALAWPGAGLEGYGVLTGLCGILLYKALFGPAKTQLP